MGLIDIHPADLGATVLNALVALSRINPAAVDDVIVGCVSQSDEPSFGIGRPCRPAISDAAAYAEYRRAGLIHDVPTCKPLIERIVGEATTIIADRLARFANSSVKAG